MITNPNLIDASKKTKFIAHAPCRDGHTALWAARTVHGEKAEYMGEAHSNQKFTKALIADPEVGTYSIYFLDYCPDRELLVELQALAAHVFVLDHHQTTEEKCGDLWYVYVDKTRSGAGIAWDYFAKTTRPLLVDIVEDYDLWKFEIPETKAVCAWLDTQDMTFENWDNIAAALEDAEAHEDIVLTGQAYLDHIEYIVTKKLVTRRKLHVFILDGHRVAAVNSPIFGSETGNHIALNAVNNTALIYYRSGERYHFSLRSTPDGLNVAHLAEKFGGGGHARSAGFVLDSLEGIEIKSISNKEKAALFPKK